MEREKNLNRTQRTVLTYDWQDNDVSAAPHTRGKKKRGAKTVPRGTAQRTAERVRRRHRQMVFFYIFMFLFVMTAAVVLSLTVLFKIDTIQVEGSTRYSAQEIVKAAGIVKGENLFLAKTKFASFSIQKKLPYIGTALVSRGLPAKIIINVKEGTSSGAVEVNGKYAVLDENEKVMEFTDTPPKQCPLIKGLSLSTVKLGEKISYKDEKTRAMFQTLVQALERNKVDKVTAIDVSDKYNFEIVYDGRIIMKLGLPDELDFKFRYANSILKQDADIREKAKGIMDLSNAQSNKVPFEPDYSSG